MIFTINDQIQTKEVRFGDTTEGDIILLKGNYYLHICEVYGDDCDPLNVISLTGYVGYPMSFSDDKLVTIVKSTIIIENL